MDFSKFNIIIPPQDIECNPQCLQRIAAGDKKEFEWLYKNYCSKLYEYIFLLTTNKQLSEDIVQDVFIKIWKKREQLSTVTNFNAYIFFVAKNLLLDKWRKQQNEKLAIKNSQLTTHHSQNLFHQRNQQQQLNAAIKTLPPKQELIYRLIREEGCTRDEISKELNISPNTVRNTMHSALQNLKKNLQPGTSDL